MDRKVRLDGQGKAGQGKPKGVRLGSRTNLCRQNPMGGARMEQAWLVSAEGREEGERTLDVPETSES
jgi:hypothetical protein